MALARTALAFLFLVPFAVADVAAPPSVAAPAPTALRAPAAVGRMSAVDALAQAAFVTAFPPAFVSASPPVLPAASAQVLHRPLPVRMAAQLLAEPAVGAVDHVEQLRAPVVAVIVGLVFLTIVLFIEAYKPNTITRLPRWILGKLGVKSA